MSGVSPATVVIDNGEPLQGELRIEVEQIDVSTASGSYKPDSSWSFVDSLGHYHAWATDNTLPTTHLVEMPPEDDGEPDAHDESDDVGFSDVDDYCPGDSDPLPIHERRCVLCDEPVEPKWVTDVPPGVRDLRPGRVRYEVVVYDEVHAEGRVSVRVDTPSATMFGFGAVTSIDVTDIRAGAPTFRTYLIATEPQRHAGVEVQGVNGVDNVITSVEFVDSPQLDDGQGEGGRMRQTLRRTRGGALAEVQRIATLRFTASTS